MLKLIALFATSLSLLLTSQQTANAADHKVSEKMSFFLTSKGPGNGANLGGLSGADNYCQSLAESVGAGNKRWHAYLSVSA